MISDKFLIQSNSLKPSKGLELTKKQDILEIHIRR